MKYYGRPSESSRTAAARRGTAYFLQVIECARSRTTHRDARRPGLLVCRSRGRAVIPRHAVNVTPRWPGTRRHLRQFVECARASPSPPHRACETPAPPPPVRRRGFCSPAPPSPRARLCAIPSRPPPQPHRRAGRSNHVKNHTKTFQTSQPNTPSAAPAIAGTATPTRYIP
jgi:hypothetical protein